MGDCCGREKEHPAELAASIPAFQQDGDEREVLLRLSGQSSICATAECLDGWQQGLGGLPPISVWIGARWFPEINFSPFIKLQTDSSSKKFKSVLARMSLGRRWCKASLNRQTFIQCLLGFGFFNQKGRAASCVLQY